LPLNQFSAIKSRQRVIGSHRRDFSSAVVVTHTTPPALYISSRYIFICIFKIHLKYRIKPIMIMARMHCVFVHDIQLKPIKCSNVGFDFLFLLLSYVIFILNLIRFLWVWTERFCFLGSCKKAQNKLKVSICLDLYGYSATRQSIDF
jgi:hypothetical protein